MTEYRYAPADGLRGLSDLPDGWNFGHGKRFSAATIQTAEEQDVAFWTMLPGPREVIPRDDGSIDLVVEPFDLGLIVTIRILESDILGVEVEETLGRVAPRCFPDISSALGYIDEIQGLQWE